MHGCAVIMEGSDFALFDGLGAWYEAVEILCSIAALWAIDRLRSG